MPSENVWPPPPAEPDQPFEYDALLAGIVRACRPGSAIMRSTLARRLRRATKIDRRKSVIVVNDFCDRFQIFPKQRVFGWGATILFHVAVVGIAFAICMNALWLRKAIYAAPTRAVALRLFAQYEHVGSVLCGMLILTAATVLYLADNFHRRRRRDALAKLSG
jgi:hypothetical protein